jgi:hypothetical protein
MPTAPGLTRTTDLLEAMMSDGKPKIELTYEQERQIAQKNNTYLPKRKLNRWMIMGVLLMELSAAAGLLYIVYKIYVKN